MPLSPEAIEELAGEIAAQISAYAVTIVSQGMEAVEATPFVVDRAGFEDGGLNLDIPGVRDAVDSWDDIKNDWIDRYGSIDGWSEFKNYWSTGTHFSGDTSLRNASVSEAFSDSKFTNTRNWYGAGNSGTYNPRASY